MQTHQFQSDSLHKWRLKVDDGRQTWHFLESAQDQADWPQTDIDKYWLGILESSQLSDKATFDAPLDYARNGFRFLQRLQTNDGHWAGEYGGPMFLIPGLVIAMYVTRSAYPPGFRDELIRYLKNRAHPIDGGWGVHIEGVSTVFGTALNYVALRLLGVDAENSICVKARGHLHALGGATGCPSWGKFWLAVLGVYEWDGMNPVPTEPWLLPYVVPIHPARMWIHTRQEIYVEDYDFIDWPKQRNHCASVDLYAPHTHLHNFAFGALSIYEKFPILRSYSQKVALEHIKAEDQNTDYADLGPVNKVMNMLVIWMVDGPDSESFKRHLDRNLDFMWMAGDGMRMNGTNGSQLWDTAFICQAISESGLAKEKEFESSMTNSLQFIEKMQIQENMEGYQKFFRHASKGAWPFSTRTQSYTVSDCTAEGLKAALMLQKSIPSADRPISDDRLKDAADILLSMQNSDGGFASYEQIRGPAWLEWLNPAEVFGNIMIEYSYPECTTAVLLGLSYFKKQFPDYRPYDIEDASDAAVEYIKRAQREDGSWFGSWAICFTYATFFGLESLASVGETYANSSCVRKACNFLVSKQMEDGGWGEKYKACEIGAWVNHEKSQVVNTAWAVLSLLAAEFPNQDHIRRGILLIKSRQQPNGEWLQENIEGVFNKNCMISYPNYKFTFCIWALGRYANRYDNKF